MACGPAELLEEEKEHTRLGDELARQRRELPWVRVEKEYRFDTDDGEQRARRAVRRPQSSCSSTTSCSARATRPVARSSRRSPTPIDGVLPHLHARDVTMLLVSQAPLEKLQAYKRRMGWRIPWVSSARQRLQLRPRLLVHRGTDARAWRSRRCSRRDRCRRSSSTTRASSGTDVAGYLTESPGFSAFVLDDGAVYQTYSTTWRGLEFLMGYYPILDQAPKGRDEGEAWQLWIRRHDEY